MTLPFSEAAFLDVFGAFNGRLWPLAIVLWIVTVAVVLGWIRGVIRGRHMLLLLAAHWLVSGVAYHWLFFRDINPAAALFALVFIIQGGVFLWLAFFGSPTVTSLAWRRRLGIAFAVYGLFYPVLGFLSGLRYPRMPLFAVPCPTTLISAGLLLTSANLPRAADVLPACWCLIGSAAAFTLGIRADLALIPAGAMLLIDLLLPRAVRAGRQ